jgi:hypothetical protein
VPAGLRGEGVAAAVRGGGGFNAVGTLDRTLVNPLPVVLELADRAGLSDTQIKSIEAISVQLDRSLNARREELGRRFDGVPPAEQAAIFREIQPQVQRGREEILGAMNQVREILTADQWQRLPPAVRNAGQPQAGGPGRQGAGGGRPPGGGGDLDG